jgi:PIN domain nuclease of toxin-antitoxin system
LIFLLDTHLLLWSAGEPGRLSEQTRARLLDPASSLMFSAASIWEIAIKNALGREDFRVDPRRLWRMLLAHGYNELAVNAEHAVAAGALPPLHKDPFDRILVAQAKTEAIILLTSDARVAEYGEPVRLA